MTHTPAPWQVRRGPAAHSIVGADTHRIASITFNGQNYWPDPSHDAYPAGRAEGNARLIAAAPDLLAACEAASDLIDRSPLGPDWRTNGQTDAYYIDRADMDALRTTVRAAIARAKGDSPKGEV